MAAAPQLRVLPGGGEGHARPRQLRDDTLVARMRVRLALAGVLRMFADPIRRRLARRAA